jgi:ankyrin repeat protein
LVWAEENLTKQEVNKFLLATDNDGITVFHIAAQNDNLDLFQGILIWAEEYLTKEEVN